MARLISIFLLVSMVVTLIPSTVGAQSEQPQLNISLRKEFGYDGFDGAIQGTFSISASTSQNLVKVTFFLDEKFLGEVMTPPFKLRFQTETYPLGDHTLSAKALTGDNQTLISNRIHVRFVTADEGWKAAGKIMFPIFGLVLLGMAFSIGIPFFLSRRRPGQGKTPIPTAYGIAGGAVCPVCRKPFARHWYTLHFGSRHLENCPHCGKTSLVLRASQQELAAAEQFYYTEQENQPHTITNANHIKREIDDTRYYNTRQT